MRYGAIIFAAALLASPAPSQAREVSVAAMLTYCREDLATYSLGICRGYLLAIAEAGEGRHWCMGARFGADTFVLALRRWAEGHGVSGDAPAAPPIPNVSAVDAVASAYSEAFPCQPRSGQMSRQGVP